MIGIEIKNVSFSYENQVILSDVSGSLSRGDKIRLTGDNGSGKTTFLKLLCSLLKPQSGSILYVDTKFELEPRWVRKLLGVSMDESHLLPHFTVAENLQMYQKFYARENSFSTIAIWLDRFRLQTHRETPIQYLSQGEQKKVSLIKSLMIEPDTLILDEPTNSLDVESKETLGQILFELPSDKILIVSTHDHVWANTWSNREIKIRNGRFQ